MAQPTFTLDQTTDTFTFKNGHLTIEAQAEGVPPAPVTVEHVTLTTPHETFTLPVTDVLVPALVAEHVFDLLI